MNKKYLIFSAIFWIGLICFINFVSPDSLWSKIVFFILLFFCFFTTAYIFPKKHIINLFIALYLLSTVLLQYFRQFSILNFIFTTALFVCLFFIFYKTPKKIDLKPKK
jgi:hypothetical protein